MAVLNVYAIKDSKIGVFGKPFCEASEIQAIRGLNIAVNDPTIQLSMFPEDFDMYRLGTYDDESGKIECFPEGPKFVVAAISQKKLMEEVQHVSDSSTKPLQSDTAKRIK